MEGDQAPREDSEREIGDVDALNCNDWDLEFMQFLIDSFICMFPTQHCCDYGQECCYGMDAPSVVEDRDWCRAQYKPFSFDDREDDGILDKRE